MVGIFEVYNESQMLTLALWQATKIQLPKIWKILVPVKRTFKVHEK